MLVDASVKICTIRDVVYINGILDLCKLKKQVFLTSITRLYSELFSQYFMDHQWITLKLMAVEFGYA